MNDIVKYGAIAVGGYFVLKYLGIDLLNMNPPATGIATSPQAATPANAGTQNTANMVAAAARAGGVDPNSAQSVDTWNWYYQQVRGVAGPSPEELFPGVDRDRKYTMSEWWDAMGGHGFSGLGAIAHFVNPYHNPNGTPFGSNLTPGSMEKYIVRIGG